MVDNQALIVALRQFTTAVAGDRIRRAEQHQELIQALNQQREANEVLLAELHSQVHPLEVDVPPAGIAAVVALPRPTPEVVKTIPKFQGAHTDCAQGFIDNINRIGGLEEWTNAQRFQVAVRCLAGQPSNGKFMLVMAMIRGKRSPPCSLTASRGGCHS